MLPTLFKIGPFPVHSWGVLLMLGFLWAAWRAATNAHRYKIAPEDVWDVSLFGLFGGVLGGRLVFVLLNLFPHNGQPGYFMQNPGEILAIWTGGMTSFGGFAGGILAGVIACKWRKVPVWDMADLAAVSFPIGYLLGRVGCFLNGCCYGGPTSLPWATRFHVHGANGQDILTVPSHPAQLYSALIALGMYLALLPLEKGRKFRGQVMLAFLFLYSIYRFLIEFVREGATADQSGLANMTQGQIASLVLAVAVAVVYAIRVRKAGQTPTSPTGSETGDKTVIGAA
jgi:phosphatidylglycerol:prolipoprotein diacylglycerol transferase